MHIEDKLVFCHSSLSHLKVVLELSQYWIALNELSNRHGTLWPDEINKWSENIAHLGRPELEWYFLIPLKNTLDYLHLVWVNSFTFFVSAEHRDDIYEHYLLVDVLIDLILESDWLQKI
jgi:hypothetical protein